MTDNNSKLPIPLPNRSTLKNSLRIFVRAAYKTYIFTMRETTMWWRHILAKENRARVLLESEAIVLFFNTVLFAVIALGIQNQTWFIKQFLPISDQMMGFIPVALYNLTFANILMFLFKKLGWVDNLLGDEVKEIEKK